MGRYLSYLRSDAWKARRAAVIERCSNTCEVCNVQPVEEIHHRTYERLYREQLDDLLGVCSYCHEKLHGLTTEGGEVIAERWRALFESDELKQRLEYELERVLDAKLSWKYWTPSPNADIHELRSELTADRRFLYGRWECELVGSIVSEDGLSVRLRFRDGGRQHELRLHNIEQRFRSGMLRLDGERKLFIDVDDLTNGLRFLAGDISPQPAPGNNVATLGRGHRTITHPHESPAIEVPRIVGTIRDMLRFSRTEWVHWNDVALKHCGSKDYAELLMGYADLPEWRKLFAPGRGNVVKLTPEGVEFAQCLLSPVAAEVQQDAEMSRNTDDAAEYSGEVVDDDEGLRVAESKAESCPKCGKSLMERKGPVGLFIGCSGYPTCRYSRGIR